jgi:hypothetical protein
MSLITPIAFSTPEPELALKKREMGKSASDMEQMLFTHILKQIFPEESSYFGTSHGASLIRSFWIESLSQSGGAKTLGISPHILRKLESDQHSSSPSTFSILKQKV